MASGTISTRPQEEGVLSQGRYDDFIQKRLEQTRRQVRLVDAGSGVVLLAAASLLFFLAVAVADHWLFPHGLGFFVRFLLWCVWVGVAGWFAWRSVAPSVMRRINPVFAAQAIEHGRPTLKNSLINFLLLRSHPDDVAPVVYQAMQYRAASDLSRVPVEHAVDHRRLVHLSYLLAGAVVLFALYLAFSPKNPLVSAARVLWPWSSLPAPTRVHIEDVRPGNAVAFQGDRQEIKAHISGLRSGEEVSLLLTTADGQLVDDRVTMARTGDDNLYTIELPQGGGGMQQDTLYRITAGDARTPQFKLEVRIAPTILVDRVDYDYPPYTALPPRTIKGQGDIKALEGTRVTIHATANLPNKDADIDLAGLQSVLMKSSGTQATGDFTLALDSTQNWRPLFDHYQIIFRDTADRKIQHPIQYHIDVDRDYPPEVKIDEPKEESVAVPENGRVKLSVHATDDYGLRRVAFHAECNGKDLGLPVLIDRVAPDKAFTKPYDGDCDFRPAELGLHKGDEVKYWAEAEDNKEPRANHAETARRTIRIVDDQEGSQGEKNQGQQGSGQGQSGGKPQNGNNSAPGKGTPDDKGQGEKAQGEQGAGESANDGSSKGQPSPSGKGGGDKKQGQPQKSSDGGTKGSGKPDKGTTAKDQTASDSKSGEKDDQGSSDGGGPQDKRPLNQEAQAADVIKDSLKDLEKQKQPEQQQSKPEQSGGDPQSGQQPEQKPQDGGPQGGQPQKSGTQGGQPQKSGTQGGQPQNNGTQGGQPQNDQPKNNGGENGTKQGSGGNGQKQGAEQGAQKSQTGSDGKTQEGSNSGNPQSQEKQVGSASGNNASGKQPTPGSEKSGAQGAEKASPKPGSDSQQPGGSSQPKGGEKPGEQRNGSQSSPQNAESQGKNQPKANGSSENTEANSGGSNKPDVKQGGGNQSKESQASGGAKPANEKMPGGKQGGSQSGGASTNAEKKRSGGEGGDNKSQLPTSGEKPGKKEGSSGGNSGNQELPVSSKTGQKPKPEGGNSSGGCQGSQSKPGNKEQNGGSSGAGGEQKPNAGQGEKASSGGGKESSDGTKGSNPGNGAEGDSRQMDPGRSGEGTKESNSGSPAPQTDSGPGEKKAGDSNGTGNKPNDPQSPGNSEKTSDANGQSPGDKKGNGGGGGGGDQSAKKNGKGPAGTHSAGGEDGGSVSNEKGAGATGTKAGEARQATGNTASPRKESGSGGGDKAHVSEQPSSDNSPNPQNNSKSNSGASQPNAGGNQPGQQSSQPSGQQGSNLPTGGSRANGQDPPPPADLSDDAKADEPDLALSNKQVDLALRHLKDEMTKPKSNLMDRLGWTPEEAKKFVDNIEKLRDSAKQPGSNGEAGKKAYDEFLKDLGLRPHGTRVESVKTRAEDVAHVRDAGGMEPPAEYLEQSRDYSKTMAEGNHK
jgi:collagen type III alpha